MSPLNCYPGTAFRIVLLLLIFASPAIAQQSPFSPANEDVSQLKKWYDTYEASFKRSLSSLPSTHKSDFEKIYKARWDNIKEKFDKKEIYTNAKAQQYLDGLVDEIVRANPSLKDKAFKCYFSRSGVPNASYIGEGIILINMGLFHRLNDENQLAFVVAHEIAHFLLQHVEYSINRYVTSINSKEVQAQLRKIKTSEYRKREQLESLVKGLSFSSFRHSRNNEGQADSMAVELVRNTRYDVTGALSSLALLDTIDTDRLNTAACLERYFNAREYPFQKKWLAKEEGLLGGHAKLSEDRELADSLKTHPDCSVRIKAIEPLVKQYAQSKNITSSPLFAELKNTFRYEIIGYAFASDNYTRSLLYCLELLQERPADPYLVAQTGKIFNSCYSAQKAHILDRYIDLPAPGYSPGYNLLLQFIQNLYNEDYAGISYHFLKRFVPDLNNYEPFKNAYNTSSQIVKE